MKTPEEWAAEAMQRHFGFPPLPSDWDEKDSEGQPGLALCIADAIRKAVEVEREACFRLAHDHVSGGGEEADASIDIAKDIRNRGKL